MLNLKLIHRIALTVFAILLSACVSSTYSNPYKRPAVKPGSIVQIYNQYEVPNEYARVYFQNGSRVNWSDIDRFTPYCYILMQDIRDAGQPRQLVKPGRFYVAKVLEINDYSLDRTYVASTMWEHDGGPPSNIDYKLEMRLSSNEQPGVRALICVKNINDYVAYNKRYPNIDEIKIALGGLITIEAPYSN